jgi:hypothetical protein
MSKAHLWVCLRAFPEKTTLNVGATIPEAGALDGIKEAILCFLACHDGSTPAWLHPPEP